MTLPRTRLVRQNDTHRLIPSKYSEGGASVLARIADDDAHLEAIFDLDHATNDRLPAENNLLPEIGIHEIVFGVPYCRIVNAAFCHPIRSAAASMVLIAALGMRASNWRPRRPRSPFTSGSSSRR